MSKRLEAPSTEGNADLRPRFIYKCTSCQTRNGVNEPPEDFMVPCWKCGFLTVQTLHRVKTK